MGAIIMWAFNYDALWGYELLFKKAFGSIKLKYFPETYGILILVCFLGFSVASRAGFFNVGLHKSGFFKDGSWRLGCPFFPKYASLTDDSMTVLIAGCREDYGCGAIPGCLRAISEPVRVIITIMMNYIVLYVENALIHSFPNFLDVQDPFYNTNWSSLHHLTDKSQMNIGIFCHHRSGGHLVLDEENNTWF